MDTRRTRPTQDSPIGVFDSGIGGLTVLKAITQLLPNERIVYFGDTARLPYGSKSDDTIVGFSIENVIFLNTFGIKAIVVACNTATAVALDFLRGFIKIPIIGVIEPGAEAAVRTTRSKRIGIIGTKTTINQHAYARAINEIDPNVEVLEVPTPLLVHLVEENWIDRDVTKAILKEYLSPLLGARIDTLILGCTHYPFLAKCIQEIGPDFALIDSAHETAIALRRMLRSEHLLTDTKDQDGTQIYLSDLQPDSTQWIDSFMGKKIPISKAENFPFR
jgi:glutamate racemase